MTSTAKSVTEYLENLTEDRREIMTRLYSTISEHLPKGFTEGISYGMIGWSVPLETYPAGYHCTPGSPLPFLSIASQKNFIALYHMGIYADESLYQWFLKEYSKHSPRKLDMGKSCIRFKKPDEIPFTLIAKLVSKMSPSDWILIYEEKFKK